MLRGRRPSTGALDALARSVRDADLTYDDVGATAMSSSPTGFRHDRFSVDLGAADIFEEAADRLRAWQPHRGAGISIGTDGPIEAGTNVALAASLPIGYVLATCRVVYVEDKPERFAWAYGTLPLHPEVGEERFAVVRRNGRTQFEIRVFSRPHHWLARTGGPLTRRLQLRATRAYLDAMMPDRW